MWSRQLFTVWLFTLTILATQSHDIHKRGLLSKLFGGNSRSTENADVAPHERSTVRELLKNPLVITMLSAAVGMVVQQALATKNMNGVCDNRYVKMAYMAGGIHPHLQQALNILGCNGANQKHSNDNSNEENDSEEETSNNRNRNTNNNNQGTVESDSSAEKQSKLQQMWGMVRGEKGATGNFVKGLFGLNKDDKSFKQGHTLPSTSYKLDEDDAKSMKNLETEIEQSN